MFCPQVSRLAHQAAVVSRFVDAAVVEVEALPELATEFRVTSVPKVLVNGRVERLGSQTESDLLDAINEAIGGRL